MNEGPTLWRSHGNMKETCLTCAQLEEFEEESQGCLKEKNGMRVLRRSGLHNCTKLQKGEADLVTLHRFECKLQLSSDKRQACAASDHAPAYQQQSHDILHRIKRSTKAFETTLNAAPNYKPRSATYGARVENDIELSIQPCRQRAARGAMMSPHCKPARLNPITQADHSAAPFNSDWSIGVAEVAAWEVQLRRCFNL